MSNFNTNKINGSTLEADEWNQLQDLENLVSTSGINPDTSLLNQIPQAVSNYVAIANFYTDNGIANAYNLTPINNFKSPTQYITGMLVRFRTTNANTGASTVNVASLGVKNIKKADGTTDLVAGDIATGTDIELRYDGTNFLLNSVVLASASTTTQGIIQIATNDEVLAGIIANKAIVPSAFTSLFSTASLLTSGSCSFASLVKDVANNTIKVGIIKCKLQSTILPAGGAGTSITFDSAFPTACVGVFITPATWSGANPQTIVPFITSIAPANFIASNPDGDTNITSFYYIAIGY